MDTFKLRQLTDKLKDREIALVIGNNHYWGKGFTVTQAWQAAQRPRVFTVYASADPWIAVDEMGRITYYPTAHDVRKPYRKIGMMAPNTDLVRWAKTEYRSHTINRKTSTKEWRVAPKAGTPAEREAQAYYTEDLQDAILTMEQMHATYETQLSALCEPA